jgi:hypothetical protein
MDHMNLSDELRKQLLESAAWGKAGITPVLSEEVVEETEERVDENAERGYGKSKPAGSKAAADEEEKRKIAKKAGKMEVAHTEHEDAEGSEELEEAVHVCPLCVSQLSEAIEEERILEHLDVVVGLIDRLSQLNEGDEDVDTIIDETIEELLFQDLEEE